MPHTLVHTFRQPRKYSMPRPSRNRSQFLAVSSVTFHIVDQATSITSSKTRLDNRSLIKFNIVYVPGECAKRESERERIRNHAVIAR